MKMLLPFINLGISLFSYSIIYFLLRLFHFPLIAKWYYIFSLIIIITLFTIYIILRIINPKIILYHFAFAHEWENILANGFNEPKEEAKITKNKFAYIQTGADVVSFVACGNVLPVINMKKSMTDSDLEIVGYEINFNFNDLTTLISGTMVTMNMGGFRKAEHGKILEAT